MKSYKLMSVEFLSEIAGVLSLTTDPQLVKLRRKFIREYRGAVLINTEHPGCVSTIETRTTDKYKSLHDKYIPPASANEPDKSVTIQTKPNVEDTF